MVRAPFYDKNGMKRGAWSAEEDHKLRSYVLKYGHWNWREIPRFAGLKRCGKSCRLRWKNYLQPELKHGNFTEEEDAMIMKLHEEFGNRWSMIAAKLHGRTDNEIKNHWHTHLKKLAKRNLTKSDQEKEDCSTVTSQSDATLLNCSEAEAESICFDSPPNMILESSSLSPSASSESVDVVDDICLPSSFTLDNGSISDFSNTVLTDDVSIPSTFSPDNGSISISDFDIDFMDDVFLPSSVTPDCGLSVSDFTIGDVCDLHSSQTLHEINQSSGDLWREFFEEDNINNNQDGYHIPISSTVRNEFEQPILPFDMYLDDSANLLYQVMQEWS